MKKTVIISNPNPNNHTASGTHYHSHPAPSPVPKTTVIGNPTIGNQGSYWPPQPSYNPNLFFQQKTPPLNPVNNQCTSHNSHQH